MNRLLLLTLVLAHYDALKLSDSYVSGVLHSLVRLLHIKLTNIRLINYRIYYYIVSYFRLRPRIKLTVVIPMITLSLAEAPLVVY